MVKCERPMLLLLNNFSELSINKKGLDNETFSDSVS